MCCPGGKYVVKVDSVLSRWTVRCPGGQCVVQVESTLSSWTVCCPHNISSGATENS